MIFWFCFMLGISATLLCLRGLSSRLYHATIMGQAQQELHIYVALLSATSHGLAPPKNNIASFQIPLPLPRIRSWQLNLYSILSYIKYRLLINYTNFSQSQLAHNLKMILMRYFLINTQSFTLWKISKICKR